MPSHLLRYLCCLLFLSGVHSSPIPAQTQTATTAAAKAAVIAPYLDEQTLIVARIDLRQLDPVESVKTLGRLAPPTDTDFPKQLAKLEQNAKEGLHVLSATGVSELFVVVSLADLPKEPFFVVAPLKAGVDSQKAATVLRQLLRFEQAEARPGVVVLGKTSIVERLKNLRPAARPEVVRGFERAGEAALSLLILPSDDTRRVVREMLPRLPDEVGGGSGKMLADGVQWAVLAVQAPPRLSLSAVIQSRDPESAAALRGMIVSALQLLTRAPDVRRQWPEVDDLARLITPRLSGEQLVLQVSDKSGEMEQILKLAVTPLQAARTAAGRAQSMNNLKQLGLAMHNFHDTHRHLPPQAIRGKDGKALLSWRVAILPFLDAEPLYKQFKLDEPWDSEHNKALIGKMPSVFASPGLGDERRVQGLTSYLVPLTQQPAAVASLAADDGKKPAQRGKEEMVFDIADGAKFQQITDGTSNTVMVVEVHPKSAVVWSKPDDLVIDAQDPFKGLRDQPNAFATLFGDGSARVISYNVDPKTLLHLFQMNDGHPIGELK